MSRQAGSIVRGISKPRRISAISGPAAGGGYVLRRGRKVKVSEDRRYKLRLKRRRVGSVKINGLSWQEWQGSNLRPPVLEFANDRNNSVLFCIKKSQITGSFGSRG